MQFCPQAKLAEQEKQVHLGDTELDVLTLRRGFPLQWAGILDLVDGLDLGAKDATLIDPATEARRNRNIGARRDNMTRDLIDVSDVLQCTCEGILARCGPRGDGTKFVRNCVGVDAVGRDSIVFGETVRRAETELAFRRLGCEPSPLVDGVGQLGAQLVDLRR